MSLYKIGDTYFVRDGNHRVSVAKYHKVAAIDAEVVEIRGQMRREAMHRTVRTACTPTSTTTPSSAWYITATLLPDYRQAATSCQRSRGGSCRAMFTIVTIPFYAHT